MNAKLQTIGDPIEITLAEQAIALAKIRSRWNAVKAFYRPIVNALHCIAIEPRFDSELNICFSGDAHKLAQVVRILRVAGMQTTGSRPKQGDTTWSAYYKHPDCATDVWLYFTSSVCRRVKVGTKMVEQDVYETQCADISETNNELPAPTAPALMEDLQF